MDEPINLRETLIKLFISGCTTQDILCEITAMDEEDAAAIVDGDPDELIAKEILTIEASVLRSADKALDAFAEMWEGAC